MKKKTLAAMQFEHRQMAQMVEVSMEKSVEIIETAFSALASIDPGAALLVIESLEGHKENLTNLVEERKNDKKQYIEILSGKLSDVITLEDSDDDEDLEDEEGEEG